MPPVERDNAFGAHVAGVPAQGDGKPALPGGGDRVGQRRVDRHVHLDGPSLVVKGAGAAGDGREADGPIHPDVVGRGDDDDIRPDSSGTPPEALQGGAGRECAERVLAQVGDDRPAVGSNASNDDPRHSCFSFRTYFGR